MPPPDEANSLEFQYSDLRLDSKVETKDIVEKIHDQVTTEMGLVTDQITGVHFLPNDFWPQRVKIYCADSDTRDTLKQRGLDLYGGHINLFEPGQGVKKIEIKNVPGDMPSHLIKSVLEQYGRICQWRHEKYKFRSGRQIEWTTGHRIAWMREVDNLPPIITVNWKGKDISLNVWHYGQTEKYCRHCKDIVPKDHKCSNVPQKRCFGCGSLDHMRGECPVGNVCHNCGEKDHIASICTNKRIPKENFTNPSNVQKSQVSNENFTNPINVQKSQVSFVKGKLPTIPPGKIGLISQSVKASLFSEGATGNSGDLSPKLLSKTTTGKNKSKMADINSDVDYPGLEASQTKGEAAKLGGKGENKVSSDKTGDWSPGGKRAKRMKMRARKRYGSVSLITDFLKKSKEDSLRTDCATDPESQYETETDEEGETSDNEKEEVLSSIGKKAEETTSQTKNSNSNESEASKEKEKKEDFVLKVTNPEGEEGEEVIQVSMEEKESDEDDSLLLSEGERSMDVDKTADDEKTKLTLFGGSNCENMESYLTGDEEIQIKPTVLYEGGLKFTGTSKKISELDGEHAKEHDDFIGIHVGSADFPYQSLEDQELKHGQYLRQLNDIKKAWPDKDIIICSIPPRVGKEIAQLQINDQIKRFNIKLKETADKSLGLHFCNTYPYLVDKDEVCPALFKKPDVDPHGVHFNEAGKKEVAKAITEEIKVILRKRLVPAADEMQQVRTRVRSAEVVCSEEMNSSPAMNRNV